MKEGFPSLEVSVNPSSRLVFFTEPESLAAEKFRRFLGVRLRQIRQNRPLKKVLITSTIPEVAFNQQNPLLAASQNPCEVHGNQAPALLRDRASDQYFLKWPTLPHLAEANAEKTKFLGGQTLRFGEKHQTTRRRDRYCQRGKPFRHRFFDWSVGNCFQIWYGGNPQRLHIPSRHSAVGLDSNTAVAIEIMSGYSTPDCSVPDLCSASNIRLILPRSCSYDHPQVCPVPARVLQVLIQIQRCPGRSCYFGRRIRRLCCRSVVVGCKTFKRKSAGDLLDHFRRDALELSRISMDECVFAQRVH